MEQPISKGTEMILKTSMTRSVHQQHWVARARHCSFEPVNWHHSRAEMDAKFYSWCTLYDYEIYINIVWFCSIMLVFSY